MPRQTSKEQPNHCYLDQCFDFIELSARHPYSFFSYGKSNESVRSTTHRLGNILKPRVPGVRSTTCAFPATFHLAPGSQLLSTVRRIGPDLAGDVGAMERSPESRG